MNAQSDPPQGLEEAPRPDGRLLSDRLSIGRLVAYALPAAPIVAIDTPISIYLPSFYASTGALGLSLIGSLVLAARLAEIPITLVAGAASDRLGPPGRRRRLWLAAATPVVMLAIWRLFIPPARPDAAYLLVWLMMSILGGVMLYINHIAWGSEAARGYDDRSRIQAARQAASVAGLLLVLLPPILIERTHPPDLERARMAAIAGFFLILLPLCVTLALRFAPERPQASQTAPPAGAGERPTFAAVVRALTTDRALRRLILVDLLDSGSIGVVTSLFVFLSRDIWRLGGLTSLLLLAYLGCGLVGLGPLMRIIRGRSKARAAAWMAIGISAALPGLALVPPGGAAIALVAILLLGFPSAANTALFDSMMGDIAAADARTGGKSRAGLYYALHMVVGRLGRGAAIAAAFWALDQVGFHPGAANPMGTTDAFRLIYVAAPMALQLAMAALLWTYPEPERR